MKKILCLLLVVLCLTGCGLKSSNVPTLKTGKEMCDMYKYARKVVFDKYNKKEYGFKWKEGEDVSQDGNGKIKLFKNDDEVYILSRKQIYANEDCSFMFSNCASLETLELKNFNTSNVKNMRGMFYLSSSLESLDVSNFDTSNVTDMSDMFHGCYELTSLDLGNFNTSNVTNMKFMFETCVKLTSLNVRNFDTSKVRNMNGMFCGCVNFRSLDLSNFDTGSLKIMASMFENCCNLETLDITNFNIKEVDTEVMFKDCHSLKNVIYPEEVDISKYQIVY